MSQVWRSMALHAAGRDLTGQEGGVPVPPGDGRHPDVQEEIAFECLRIETTSRLADLLSLHSFQRSEKYASYSLSAPIARRTRASRSTSESIPNTGVWTLRDQLSALVLNASIP